MNGKYYKNNTNTGTIDMCVNLGVKNFIFSGSVWR